jgi:hypothetical protein
MARHDSNGSTDRSGSAGQGATPVDLDAIEREHVEQLARAHAELAAAQDRSYWLDRWGVDLNELMRRPAAGRIRAALRAARELQRGAGAVKRYGQARVRELRQAAVEDELSTQAAADPGATATHEGETGRRS